jgi:hypothetical protein
MDERIRNIIYNISLGLEEGRGTLQVELTKDTENVRLSIFIDKHNNSAVEKTELTFTSDTDLKSVIDTLKWARKAQLESKGYKVII